MKRAIALLTLLLSASIGFADDFVNAITTQNNGSYEVVTNWLAFSSSRRFDVWLPRRVQVGDRLQLRYSNDDEKREEKFTVNSISYRGDICWLHDQAPTRDEAPPNSITVSPCRH